MPFSFNKQEKPLETLSVAQNLGCISEHFCSNPAGETAQRVSVDPTVPNGDWTHAPEDADALRVPPPIPPRYPEIDLRVFDHPEQEFPDTIVYSPLEWCNREPLSGSLELRPIIAATIVKLIEKLTHQYGMGTRNKCSL